MAQRGRFRHRGFVGTARLLAGLRLGRSRLDLGRLGRAADTFAGIATQAITRFTAATTLDTLARTVFAQAASVTATASASRLCRRSAAAGREHNTHGRHQRQTGKQSQFRQHGLIPSQDIPNARRPTGHRVDRQSPTGQPSWKSADSWPFKNGKPALRRNQASQRHNCAWRS